MDKEKINRELDQINQLVESVRAEVNETEPPPTDTVKTTEELKAALEVGGEIQLEHNAAFHSATPFLVGSETIITGPGTMTSDVQVIDVRPGTNRVGLVDLIMESDNAPYIIELGSNDSNQQNNVNQEPRDIDIQRLVVDSFRGKRAIEVNAANVHITDSRIYDVYSEAGQDSQAIWLGNSSGELHINGGTYEAASENFMSGGDVIKMGVVRKVIRISNAVFSKPLSWKGVIAVKNLLELKDGTDVLISHCTLENCWKSGQDGYGLVLTPTQGGQVRDVTIESCTIRNVGGISNIIGVDKSGINTVRTTVTMNNCTCQTNKAEMGGRGIFSLIGEGPESFIVHGCDIEIDGPTFIELYGTLPMDLLRVTNCRWNYGSYGIRIGGYNHGDNPVGLIKTIEIVGNTIVGAHSLFKERYPENTYV